MMTESMSRISGPLAVSVTLSLVFIHGYVACGILERSHGLPSYVGLLANRRSSLSPSLSGDEYHFDVDADKIEEPFRYELEQTSGPSAPDELDDRAIMNAIKFSTRLPAQSDKDKRMPNLSKEDKDYSFVGSDGSLDTMTGGAGKQDSNQDLALRASQMASDILRELVIARAVQRNNGSQRNQDQAATYFRQNGKNRGWWWGSSNEGSRQKRRRCKVDPSLGVKNPSFCDQDAYFGAAAYGKGIWDQAGR